MFGYDAAVLTSYPTVHAGVLHATGLANGPSPPRLLEAYQAEQRSVLERLDGTAVADLPAIAAWRRAFAKFGAKPTRYRSAPEALLRRLTKHGDIPSINALVDLGNLVSIRHALPVAVFDLAGVTGATTVRFATGEELFADLGSSESTHPDAGEVIFVDESLVVSARRWCWRQSGQSATGPTTTEALVVTESLHDGADAAVEAALADLAELLAAHQPSCEGTADLLSAGNPSFTGA